MVELVFQLSACVSGIRQVAALWRPLPPGPWSAAGKAVSSGSLLLSLLDALRQLALEDW